MTHRNIIAILRGITPAEALDEALTLLRAASQRLNRKVSDLAETIAYTGELPP